jgi:hypothetical protein
MLVEKEVIGPGTYWYVDEASGLPRRLDVTPELTKYWHDQGNKMLGLGLTVPVPYEHDFSAHPMTPKDKLLNNAGEVKEYRLRGTRLFSVVDVKDDDAKRKIKNQSIKWTSPWINSFTDGDGRKWNNVISHLALTTRPRVTKQAPFGSVAAALSMSTEMKVDRETPTPTKEGICLSIAGRLVRRKKDKKLRAQYPIAFSLLSGGIKLGEYDDPREMRRKGPEDDEYEGDEYEGGDGEEYVPDEMGQEAEPAPGMEQQQGVDLEPFHDPNGDVSMEELLCDLLSALGIHCEKTQDEAAFKRSLYNAAMTKIHELTGKAHEMNSAGQPGQPTSPSQAGQQNPLIQQEQQPMFMSIEEINKLDGPIKTLALSMHAENMRLQAQLEANAKTANSLRDAKLTEANAARTSRVAILGRMSPKVKADLDAMLAMPSMALSMGDGGAVVDPMAPTLALLEKGLADMPRLLTTPASALSIQAQPTDGEMSEEQANQIADGLARQMGAVAEQKKAS